MPRMKSNRLPNMLAFDGVDDFLTLPIVPAVTGFNLAFWAIERNFTDNARIIDWQDSGPANGFTVVETTAKNVQFRCSNAGVTNGNIADIGYVNGKLRHYVVTHDGTTAKLYCDSVLIGTDNSSVFTAAAATFSVGRRAGGGNSWNGKLGEIVFQNTVTPWTQAQITDLYYNGNITSGASYWLFNGDVLDGSGNGNHGTLTGGTYIYQGVPRVVSRNMGGSTLFNGTTSVIDCGTSPIGVGAKTVSAWIKPTGWGESNAGRICSDGKFIFSLDSTQIFKVTSDGATYKNSAPGSLILGKWNHVIATRTAEGVANLYLNGVLNGTADVTSGTPAAATSNLCIGNVAATDRTFNGKIAEAKIYNQVLTASQAQELYSTGSVSDVSPVASYALDDQPSTYIDSIGGNNGTGTATTYSSDTPVQQRMAVSNDTASLYFAAIGDVINYGNLGGTVGDTWSTVIREKMKTGSYGITLEARVWNKGTDHIRTTSTGAPAGSINGTAFNGASRFFLFDNKWHEYGFTYDGANVKCYRDGLLNQSVAFVATATDTASDFSAGNRTANSRALDGWLKSFLHYRNRVLTADEIRGLYFSRTEPSTTRLLINSQLNEGAGTTAYDSSGNGNNGTITGATWSSNTPSKARTVASSRTSV